MNPDARRDERATRREIRLVIKANRAIDKPEQKVTALSAIKSGPLTLSKR